MELRKRRRSRVAVMVVFATNGALFATWATRVPAIQERLGLSYGELSIGLVGLAVGAVIGLPAAGILVSKIGSRAVTVAGLASMGCALALVAAAHNVVALTTALFAFGGGNSLLDIAMNVHAARVERIYARPIFAAFHACWSLGGIIGSILGLTATSFDLDVRIHFVTAALVFVLAGLGAGMALQSGPDATAPPGAHLGTLVLPSNAMLGLGLIAFCSFVAEGTVNDWSAVYLRSEADASPGVAACGYLAFAVGMVVGRIVTDRIVQRIGPSSFIRTAAALAAGSLGVCLLAPTAAAVVVGFGLFGLALAGTEPVVLSVAGATRPHAAAQAIAGVSTLGYLGFLAGPMTIGALAQAGSLQLALFGVLALIAAMIWLAPATRTTAPQTLTHATAMSSGYERDTVGTHR
jgi:MFS family permease